MSRPSSPWLVTGGAGFVGSHFVDALLARGADRVRVLDDLSSGSRANLAGPLAEGRVEFVKGDVADPATLAQAAEGVLGIAHFAASVGVARVVAAPGRTLANNLAGALGVVDVARASGLPLLFVSTSEVYGKSDAVPFREDSDLVLGPTTRGRWSYAAGKAAGEWLALDLESPVAVVRLFNTVGPRQSGAAGMVLPRFVAAAVAGGELKVYGDGAQSRCFCNVRDVRAGLVALAERLVDGPALGARVFNVGSAEEVTIAALAARVQAAAGGGRVVRLPYEAVYGAGFEDMRRRVPDLGAMAREVGWVPSCSLDATIAELVELARGRDDAEKS